MLEVTQLDDDGVGMPPSEILETELAQLWAMQLNSTYAEDDGPQDALPSLTSNEPFSGSRLDSVSAEDANTQAMSDRLPALKPEEEFPSSQLSIHDEGDCHVPERLMAERETPLGLQYLIQWEDCPEEKDWTWEPQDVILQDAPDMLMAWMTRDVGLESEANAENVANVYVPKKILSKRKLKGATHYLVQWEGYPKKEDWTWEPCERFNVDAPLLVENFEKGKMKKKRR
ncbi:uncharacterized protein LY89DRAFT_737795 [Mollisia scopiformis]|uniref:Chromo domain-containing protein n=1 Tax=Mollisia scopiformis TaxID=149040 RepID=A0A194WY84_MOLSC|nr:uncharacterized protein LY89DRAFT_737795 [Mollisia scopiformis]KUJ12895.1 hypothetical protein LY89DRAFT_737795 [Mollisia scopiformis]